MTTTEIQHKIEYLRKRWKEEPQRRKIIEIQAKLLKKAYEKSIPAH